MILFLHIPIFILQVDQKLHIHQFLSLKWSLSLIAA